jgi:hypothetical protein
MKNQEWIWGLLCSPCCCFKPEMREVPRGRTGRLDAGAEGEPAKTIDRRSRQECRAQGAAALVVKAGLPEGRPTDRARAEGPRGRADLPCSCAAARRGSCRPSNRCQRRTGAGDRDGNMADGFLSFCVRGMLLLVVLLGLWATYLQHSTN